MATSQYAWRTDYTYNVFGANEHLVVTLYRASKSGKKWKPVREWSYGTFMMEALANARAERRIKKLVDIYGAEAL